MKTPEQYKTGTAYFMDFEFEVSPDTFIPRPETELLVEKAMEIAEKMHKSQAIGHKLHVLDVGTGCGNIAISLTKYLPQSKITALDVSHGALLKAIKNAAALEVTGRISFVESDIFNAFKNSRIFDIIVCNPPYVSEKDMIKLPDEVKTEPRVALYGGTDGLDFLRRLIKEIGVLLKKNGCLLMEIGYDQSSSVKRLLEKNSYRNIEIYKDYNGIDRIVKSQAV